jgi:amino acid permease
MIWLISTVLGLLPAWGIQRLSAVRRWRAEVRGIFFVLTWLVSIAVLSFVIFTRLFTMFG